jgi:shikimate dehydrogenase
LVGEFGDVFRGTALASFDLDPVQLSDVVPQVDLLVNTSAVGLKGESFAGFPWIEVAPGVLVYDMVYSKGGTPFSRAARARGHRSADGLGMLAAQGEEAFFLWTGQRPSAGIMMARLQAECAEK